ncbi:MAG: FHA domain-containing protein [Rhodobacterales bacterium]|nr:FHA domain-containing protein [Rhodobacterales bacterium]
MAQEITSVIGGKRSTGTQIHLRKMELEVVSGDHAGDTASFDHDVVRLGSSDGNHFQIFDTTVSRRHAEITRVQDGILLRDLGSTNGSFVGEVKVREVFLGEERVFRVGKTEVKFTLRDEVVDVEPLDESEFQGIVGQSVAMRQVYSVLERVARTELTVLITGETGTGKELASRAVHACSPRKNGPFVVFDCGSVARSLVESELFGHERGAFTGAVSARAGVFEQAHGGTIFLDELGELPIELQPTLLRVLEQREVRRLGDRRVRPVDVRVVAATNVDLLQAAKEGRFREDLYYRLAVVEVGLPPLRDRLEDIELLFQRLLPNAGFPHTVKGITPAVARLFAEYHWPGNVRELRNTLYRAIPFSEGDLIDLQSLPDALRDRDGTPGSPSTGTTLDLPEAGLGYHDAKERLIEGFERRYLEDLLGRCAGNLSKAAREAGVDRKTVARMLKRHGIKG